MYKRPITNLDKTIHDARHDGMYGLQGQEYRYYIDFKRTAYEGMTKRTRPQTLYYKTVQEAEKQLLKLQAEMEKQVQADVTPESY